MVKPLGGRGKRAPYETIQMRVPVPLKAQVESTIADYRERVLLGDEDQDSEDQEDDRSEPSDSDVIRSQAKMIQDLRIEVEYLNLKTANPFLIAIKLVDRFISEFNQTDKLHTRNNVNLVKFHNWLQDEANNNSDL